MSEPYKLILPTTMKERLRSKAQELGIDVTKMVEQTMEMLLEGEVKPIVQNRTVTVEDAGEILLAHIEPSQAALIMDLCRDTGRRPYEYLLSYVYLAHERGETAKLIGEQFLTASMPKGSAVEANTHCEYVECGRPLVNPRRGQRFCPDPDDGTPSCGRKHSLAELHAHRAARTRGANNTAAPTQVNVEVYRRAAQNLA